MPEVLMPRLSDSMEEGTIVRWLRADGDEIARGDEIVEIETDKATMAYEADDAGVLAISAAEGATLPVGSVIATIGEGSGGSPKPRAATVSASSVARRAAVALGVEIDKVSGTGPHGRVLKADVIAAAEGVAAPAPAPQPEPAASAAVAGPTPGVAPSTVEGARGRVTVSELSRLQTTVARRMSESKATAPDFALEVEVDMTAAIELRERLRHVAERPPSLNDFVVKASANVLRGHPRVNGSYRDGRFETFERVNIGVAVATEEGLVVPTVTDADRRSLGSVTEEVRRLAERVRSATVTPPELAGATFTVSNLGMFGVNRFSGVINPPQAAILCVGTVAKRPAVAADGSVVARDLMSLTLVSDHRILYGADAARFLSDIRGVLEEPLGVLLS